MLLWLADVLRNAGLSVREIPGWESRGHGDIGDILGVLLHHTAGPATGNYPSEQVVVNGRPDLEGPLANLGLARDGTWIVIAAGIAWHAGTGSIPWCPTDQGNQHLIGIEAESTGLGPSPNGDWTAAQRDSYPRGVAALLKHLNLPATRTIGHKEWAPTRKIDPAFWDMDAFRAQVNTLMTEPPKPGGVLMALSEAEQLEILTSIRALKPGLVLPARSTNCRIQKDDAFGWAMNAAAEAADARALAATALAEIRALRAALGK